jgi:hypothetical protein
MGLFNPVSKFARPLAAIDSAGPALEKTAPF